MIKQMEAVEMISSHDLREEIERRENVANFAQMVRDINSRVVTVGLSLVAYDLSSGEERKAYTLNVARGVLVAHTLTEHSREEEYEVVLEELQVIEQCLTDENASVEQIIDRMWDAN